MRPTCVDLIFKHDDLTIVVKDVRVSYCDAGSEQYIPGPIGLAISDAVDRVVRDARCEREAGLHYVAREVVLRECPMALRDRVLPLCGATDLTEPSASRAPEHLRRGGVASAMMTSNKALAAPIMN